MVMIVAARGAVRAVIDGRDDRGRDGHGHSNAHDRDGHDGRDRDDRDHGHSNDHALPSDAPSPLS